MVAILGTPDDVVIEVVYVASSMDDIWLIIPEFVFNLNFPLTKVGLYLENSIV